MKEGNSYIVRLLSLAMAQNQKYGELNEDRTHNDLLSWLVNHYTMTGTPIVMLLRENLEG